MSYSIQIVFLCVDPLKCLTWIIRPCVWTKFVTREVFSHSPTKEGDVWVLPKNMRSKCTAGELDLVRQKYKSQTLSN